MKIEPKTNCPLDNFNPCRQLDCAWFTQIRGHNPNTGEEIVLGDDEVDLIKRIQVWVVAML